MIPLGEAEWWILASSHQFLVSVEECYLKWAAEENVWVLWTLLGRVAGNELCYRQVGAGERMCH